METLVLQRTTPIDELFSFMGASGQLRVVKESGRGIIAPEVDPADYGNDTDYLCAIPGVKERLIASRDAPASEFSPMPDDWIKRDV